MAEYRLMAPENQSILAKDERVQYLRDHCDHDYHDVYIHAYWGGYTCRQCRKCGKMISKSPYDDD